MFTKIAEEFCKEAFLGSVLRTGANMFRSGATGFRSVAKNLRPAAQNFSSTRNDMLRNGMGQLKSTKMGLKTMAATPFSGLSKQQLQGMGTIAATGAATLGGAYTMGQRSGLQAFKRPEYPSTNPY